MLIKISFQNQNDYLKLHVTFYDYTYVCIYSSYQYHVILRLNFANIKVHAEQM